MTGVSGQSKLSEEGRAVEALHHLLRERELHFLNAVGERHLDESLDVRRPFHRRRILDQDRDALGIVAGFCLFENLHFSIFVDDGFQALQAH
jgi:hypothetical protein